MTIDEATKNLQRQGIVRKHWMDKEGEDAINLGIEALKRIKELRGAPIPRAWKDLPGETEE